MTTPDKALPYPDVPWLTAERWAEILEQAANDGAEGWRRDEGGFDWEQLVRDLETREEPWPETWEHPMITKFQRVTRAAWREANQ